MGVVIATMSPIHALIAGAVHNPTALISSTTPPPPRNIHRDRHHVKQIYLSCGGGLSKGKRSQLQTLPVRRPSTNGPVLGPDHVFANCYTDAFLRVQNITKIGSHFLDREGRSLRLLQRRLCCRQGHRGRQCKRRTSWRLLGSHHGLGSVGGGYVRPLHGTD